MTTKRIKSITPMQAAKVLAALHGAMALIFVPFFLLFALSASFLPKAANAPPAGAMIGIGIGLAILMPVFYAVSGFIMGLLGAVIYNLIAGWVGGIEFEVE
jgi:uncharacterized membrane protein (DUF485 family)